MFSHTIFNGDVRSNDHTGSNPAALTNPGWWILWQSKFTCWVKYTIVSKCTQHRRHIWVNYRQLSVIQRPKWIECQFRDKHLSRCFGVLLTKLSSWKYKYSTRAASKNWDTLLYVSLWCSKLACSSTHTHCSNSTQQVTSTEVQNPHHKFINVGH